MVKEPDISRNLNSMMLKLNISTTLSSFVDECCFEIMMYYYYIMQCASISGIQGISNNF
jgi:hypothetical protein